MRLVTVVAGTSAPASAIRQGLCNDLSKEQTREVVRRFVPESRSIYATEARASAPAVPRLYIRLARDKEFGLALETAMAVNLGADVIEMDAGHMPMLSQPAELARILGDFVEKL